MNSGIYEKALINKLKSLFSDNLWTQTHEYFSIVFLYFNKRLHPLSLHFPNFDEPLMLIYPDIKPLSLF